MRMSALGKNEQVPGLPAKNGSAKSVPASPSRWEARLVVAALVLGGVFIAGYLAAYQLGEVKSVWEPFFGNGSVRVLHSPLSTILPFPDALIGLAGYSAELILTVIGGEERWRRQPLLVLIYGAIVALLALTGFFLVGLQIFVVRAACTLCLLSAAISVMIAFLASEEVLAGVRLMRKR